MTLSGCVGDLTNGPRYPAKSAMCRSIKPLFNFDPPVTDDEIRSACLQFVRKISGFTKPARANQAAFEAAVDRFTAVSRAYLNSLSTAAPPRNRDREAAKSRQRDLARSFSERYSSVGSFPRPTVEPLDPTSPPARSGTLERTPETPA
jgi:hypothetical protein